MYTSISSLVSLTNKDVKHMMRMVKLFKRSTIFGAFECVSFPEWSETKILAKVDTGAYSGALHCTYIKKSKDSKNRRVLEFSPFGHQELKFRTRDFKTVSVTSSNGHRQKRYAVRTTIRIQGKKYDVDISLTDRSGMQYEVLIGRRFLRKNKIAVDVTQYKKEHERFSE